MDMKLELEPMKGGKPRHRSHVSGDKDTKPEPGSMPGEHNRAKAGKPGQRTQLGHPGTKLELEPMEAEDDRIIRGKPSDRSKFIQPAKIRHFTKTEQQDIKDFLVELIVLVHEIQHETEQDESTEGHDERLEQLTDKRFQLFQNLSPHIERFIRLLGLAHVESAEEIELLLTVLRKEGLQRYYQSKVQPDELTGDDNPFLMQIEDASFEEQLILALKTRITSTEITSLLLAHSLESLVQHIIEVRRLVSGEFWRDSYYDL